MKNVFQTKKSDGGYVLLLAVLISSIILAMSMGVFAISLKEIALATFARDSVRAFAAASRGLECAMFYDRINSHAAEDLNTPGAYSARTSISYTPFARGSAYTTTQYSDSITEDWPIGDVSAFTCAGETPYDYAADIEKSGASVFLQTHSGNSRIEYNYPAEKTCVKVSIIKRGALTSYTSNGFSDDCNSTNPRRTQRTIEVSVNI